MMMRKFLGVMAAVCMMWAALLPVGEAAAPSGKVQGTVTWRYSLVRSTQGIGDQKPIAGIDIISSGTQDKIYKDRGARVELIPFFFDKESITSSQEQDWYTRGIAPAGSNIFVAETDEDGNYLIENIPEGTYELVLISGRAKSNSIPPEQEALMKRYVRNWDVFDLFVLNGSNYIMKRVIVQPGVPVVENYEFEAPRS